MPRALGLKPEDLKICTLHQTLSHMNKGRVGHNTQHAQYKHGM